jgi:NitT/TauT family transport system substrate-binding protein
MLAYGTALITQDTLLKKDPNLVQRFTEASLRGLAYALDHPEESVDILLKINPEIDHASALDELIALQKLSATEDVLSNGLGYIRKEKMEGTINTITDALSLPRRVDPAEVYNLDILPKKPIVFGIQ